MKATVRVISYQIPHSGSADRLTANFTETEDVHGNALVLFPQAERLLHRLSFLLAWQAVKEQGRAVSQSCA